MPDKKKNKIIEKANENIADAIKNMSNGMDTLYRATYMSSPQQSKDLDDLNDKINNSIDRIVDRNVDIVGTPSVTRLYSRILNSNSSNGNSTTDDLAKDLESMFDNGVVTDDLYSMFISNSYLRELDNEIDVVCKYMPKLEEALAVQKDCVLSADHFSKDFLSINSSLSGDDKVLFSERVKDIKKKYDLPKLVESIYEDTSKYGETFIYRVPYSTAIAKLLKNKSNTEIVPPNGGIRESSTDNMESGGGRFMLSMTSNGLKIMSEDGIVSMSESASVLKESTLRDGSVVTSSQPILNQNESFNIAIEISKSGFIESVMDECSKAYRSIDKIKSMSMANLFSEEVLQEKRNIYINVDNGEKPKDKADKKFVASDGFVNTKNKKANYDDITAPGCVVRTLPRDQVIPSYIEDINLGYYFFEIKTIDTSESMLMFKNVLGDPLTATKSMTDKGCFNSVDTLRQDQTIRYIASQLSKFIDKNFVNSNQDLSKESYMILKYNDLFNTPSIDSIKITFIPPEDMVHFYFKLDPVTHRGVSDLDKALIPAKIYSSLYITTAIGKLTRGQDKRVYYVKQTVDSNIAQNLLNTIAQIKQSNFGIRQFQSINNVLNITGRFNDYVIPTNSSGDPPIQFEVMPGQDIETPTELMESLEEMAINSTGIPLEIIQSRQSVDYAMQLTMSSSKVLRFCYKRQELFQELLDEFINPIYNYEYGENIEISVTLPPPSFINVTNTNQLIDNTKNFVNSIVEVEMAGNDDEELKNEYTSELFKYYIGSHLDVAAHKDIYDRCVIQARTKKKESHSDSEDQGF